MMTSRNIKHITNNSLGNRTPTRTMASRTSPTNRLKYNTRNIRHNQSIYNNLIPIRLLQNNSTLLRMTNTNTIRLRFTLTGMRLKHMSRMTNNNRINTTLPSMTTRPRSLLGRRRTQPNAQQQRPPFSQRNATDARRICRVARSTVLPRQTGQQGHLIDRKPMYPLILIKNQSCSN